MYFREKALEKIRYMRLSLSYLESKRGVKLEELISNYELRSAIERNLHVAIESALALGEMIISELGGEPPETNKEVFIRLGELGVIPSNFAERLAPLAGLRNILVHQYNRVDPQKILEFLPRIIRDLRDYIGYVMNFLSESSDEG